MMVLLYSVTAVENCSEEVCRLSWLKYDLSIQDGCSRHRVSSAVYNGFWDKEHRMRWFAQQGAALSFKRRSSGRAERK
ncbi:hypothetical protein INR49_015317 [Caranx melampygus]|nr:hypothetical protein INR49_015317 [Caranx melampygus]